MLTIDFNLFIRKKDYALCPQPINRKNIVSRYIWRFYIKRYKKLGKVNFNAPFFKLLFEMYTWKVPAKYFINTIREKNFVYPNETEKYLELRYGNWRIPQKKWSFFNDDKGLSKLDINSF